MADLSHKSPGREAGRKARRRRLLALWVPVLLAGGGVAIAADEIVVKAKSAEIWPGKTGLAKPVATVSNGDRVTVLARENGSWLRVRTAGGQQGYVKEGALSGLALTAGGRPVSGSASSSGLNAGNAIKGLEKSAEDFARQKNISQRAVNAVNHQLDLRKRLEDDPAEYEQFQKSGRVGSGR
jgi:hypothetical protein